MLYTFKLTRRHEFPEDSGQQLLPDDYRFFTGTRKHRLKTMIAFLDVTIPTDATKLVVYMSGYVPYAEALVTYCKRKGIKLVRLYYRRKRGFVKKEGNHVYGPVVKVA